MNRYTVQAVIFVSLAALLAVLYGELRVMWAGDEGNGPAAANAGLGESCDADATCLSGRCYRGQCVRAELSRDEFAFPNTCLELGRDDECSYGRTCTQVGPDQLCATKARLDLPCTSDTSCISGYCQDGTCALAPTGRYMDVAGLVLQRFFMVSEAEVEGSVAYASDLLFERAGVRLTLRDPISQVDHDPTAGWHEPQVRALLDLWYQTYGTFGPGMHGAMLYGEPSPDQDAFLRYGVVSGNYGSRPLCNRFQPNSNQHHPTGQSTFPIAYLTQKDDPLNDGFVFAHELLHGHGL